MSEAGDRRESTATARLDYGLLRTLLIVLALAVLALLLWQVVYALLLAFAGVLFAVFLRSLAQKLHAATRLPMGGSIMVVVAALVGLLALGIALIGPSVVEHLGQLSATVTEGVERVRNYLEQSAWGKQLIAAASQGSRQGANVLGKLSSLLTQTVDALFAIVVIVFAGIYFAIAPGIYTEGAVRLLPKSRQSRMRTVFVAVGDALWLWMLGRFIVMLTVAAVTAAGLLLIGVPLAVPLAIIAGLLEFVPFFGSIAAAVPVLLVALTVDPQTVLYAALLVLAIQQIEGNLLEPLIERKMVAIPPALILIAAVAFTLLFGVSGAILATPLLVVVTVVVKMLYMQDLLGESVEIPGRAT